MVQLPPLFTMENIENAYQWIFKIRKKYSPHSDIWDLCRNWKERKHTLLLQLNAGSYQFSPLDRYEFGNAIISLWTSQDMIALKLITQALGLQMTDHLPKSCYHIKGHGGLKKAVQHTHEALSQYQFVLRSDIKSYYDSINFECLTAIIKSYVNHPILLKLIQKTLRRTETWGGLFYDYLEKGLPMGSPLSPLLGAIALLPLDQAMGKLKDIFYARYMDDWVVLTKSKTALRKVIKHTHLILNTLKLQLHPMKTYIGKISHGFNFLAYYFDDHKILPSYETIRRFHERAVALYERPPTKRKSRRYKTTDRDISLYQVNEVAPSNEYFKNILFSLRALPHKGLDTMKRLRRYLTQWTRWLKLGLSELKAFIVSVQSHLPSMLPCWGSDGITRLGHCV